MKAPARAITRRIKRECEWLGNWGEKFPLPRRDGGLYERTYVDTDGGGCKCSSRNLASRRLTISLDKIRTVARRETMLSNASLRPANSSSRNRSWVSPARKKEHRGGGKFRPRSRPYNSSAPRESETETRVKVRPLRLQPASSVESSACCSSYTRSWTTSPVKDYLQQQQ